MATEQPRFLTLPDVAEILNVSVRQVYALVRASDLRGIQIGGRGQWRVEASELENYIARQYARSDDLLDSEAELNSQDELNPTIDHESADN